MIRGPAEFPARVGECVFWHEVREKMPVLETVVVAATITAIATIGSSMFMRATANKHAYLNTVTAERVKWLERLREDLARFVSTAHGIADKDVVCPGEPPERGGELEELKRLGLMLRLRLNPEDKYDIGVSKQIDVIYERVRDRNYDDLFSQGEVLIKASQAALKDEWEKVKHETKYGTRRPYR